MWASNFFAIMKTLCPPREPPTLAVQRSVLAAALDPLLARLSAGGEEDGMGFEFGR